MAMFLSSASSSVPMSASSVASMTTSPVVTFPLISPALLSPTSTFVNTSSIQPPTMMNLSTVNQFGEVNSAKLFLPSLAANDIIVPNFYLNPDIGASSLMLPISQYTDSCDISSIREDITKIFYYKFLDKWIYKNKHSKRVLGYLKVANGNVSLVDNLNQLDDYSKNDRDVVESKIRYIEKHLLKTEDVYRILQKFVEQTRISWCLLVKDYSYFVRESIEKTLIHRIKKIIDSKENKK